MPTYKLDLVKLPISNEIMSVYRPKGKFSLETVSDAIPKLRADTAAHMILDFSEVSFLDSAGVGALVSLFVSRRGNGRTFGMAALSKQSNAVVTVAGLQNYLPVIRHWIRHWPRSRNWASALLWNPIGMTSEQAVHYTDVVGDK